MRIKCKPEGAKYARVGTVEFARVSDMWNWCGRRLYTKELEELNATFETDLPPVPDGKEYEYRKGGSTGKPFPLGTRYLQNDMTWSHGRIVWTDTDEYFAIPIRKESCVVGGKAMKSGATIFADEPLPHGTEVLIIPKDRVIKTYHNVELGHRLIEVREDK